MLKIRFAHSTVQKIFNMANTLEKVCVGRPHEKGLTGGLRPLAGFTLHFYMVPNPNIFGHGGQFSPLPPPLTP